jgi:hypothetical protein
MTASAASTTIAAIHKIRVGFMVVSLSLQPAHGGIGSEAPDHEVVEGTRNRSKDGPHDAEDDYPSCSAASRPLVIRWLPIKTWFVHGPAPPLDLDKVYPSW